MKGWKLVLLVIILVAAGVLLGVYGLSYLWNLIVQPENFQGS